MMATLCWTNKLAWGVSCTGMAVSTLATLRTTCQMAKASTLIQMEPPMRVTGLMTSTMGWVMRNGQMAQYTRAITLRGRGTAKATSNGKMVAISQGLLSRIAWKVKVYMSGKMVGSSMAIGKTT